jgi:hypothetical protein
MLNIWC